MKINIMRSALVALLPLALSATDTLRAQTKPVATQTVTADKAEADQQVFRQLAAYSGGQLIVPPLTVPDSLLSPTREEGVMLLRGTSFQIDALRSDVFIDAATRKPIFSKHFPMESAVNLLMNVLADNRYSSRPWTRQPIRTIPSLRVTTPSITSSFPRDRVIVDANSASNRQATTP